MSKMPFRKIVLVLLLILGSWFMSTGLLYSFLCLIEIVNGSFYTVSYFSQLASLLVMSALALVAFIWSGHRLFVERRILNLAVCASVGFALVVLTGAYSGKISRHFNKPWLIQEIEEGDTEGVRILLVGDGIDPNTKDRYGFTALMSAAYTNRNEITGLLLEQGANVNERYREYGFTALSFALMEDNLEIVQILIDNGADVDARDTEGWTPLMYAVDNDLDEMMHLLLKGGVDTNARADNGETVISIASVSGDVDVINALADHGADLNAADNEGLTPLMAAACVGEIDAVQTLLSRGAEVSIENKDRKTALALARENDHAGIAELLENARAAE
jgi:ankyrin repeat protein